VYAFLSDWLWLVLAFLRLNSFWFEVQTVAFLSHPYAADTNKQLLYFFINSLRWMYKQLLSKSTPTLVVGYIPTLEVQPYAGGIVAADPYSKTLTSKAACSCDKLPPTITMHNGIH